MTELGNEIERCIRTRKLLSDGQSILVAVSGGLDSMVLLRLLADLSAPHRWKLTVAHFNHGLRGRQSDADERLVVRTASRFGLPLRTDRGDVRVFARTRKVSLEMGARHLRHSFLALAARESGAEVIALAHHADDQLELFFLRLLRGTGSDGLRAMGWIGHSPADPSVKLIRPLLGHTKAALHEFARLQKVKFREDATNASLDFQRNRIRHELLPLLRRKYQPALQAVIARIVDITSAEAAFAAEAAAQWLSNIPKPEAGKIRPRVPASPERTRCCDPEGAAQVTPSVTSAAPGSLGGPFEELPVAVQRRCVQAELLALGVSPEYELIEHLRLKPEVPIGVPSSLDPQRPTGQGEVREVFRTMLGAVQWRPKRDLTFKAAIAELHLEELSGQLTFGHLRISWSVKTGRNGRKPMPVQGSEVFDADRVGSPILLRFWRPGDRFQPIGTNCSVKLQDFLTNRRVPAERRRQLLLAVSAAGEVFWVEGQRISERFKLTPTTIRRLHWSWQQL